MLLDEALVFLDVSGIDTKEAALRFLAKKLRERQLVIERFEEAVVAREAIFPTGLQFQGYGIAIPHTDVEYVKREQIAVLTLSAPVEFTQMATRDVSVPVNTVFMLALDQPHAQVIVLQQLVALLQDDKSMALIQSLSSTSKNQKLVLELLSSKGIE